MKYIFTRFTILSNKYTDRKRNVNFDEAPPVVSIGKKHKSHVPGHGSYVVQESLNHSITYVYYLFPYVIFHRFCLRDKIIPLVCVL